MHKIKIDNSGIEAIKCYSRHYMWSDILSSCKQKYSESEGWHIELSEGDALNLHYAIINDNGILPDLSPNSLLYKELCKFINLVV